ncbi:hypothetical protein OHB00_46985 [Streptomyces sp. NBC_00631]|uniref:hypothetical protein n=1 Tax=Streptomyces sp. NBC_00631 TaxID=2975793 RepID=UPI0030E4CF36
MTTEPAFSGNEPRRLLEAAHELAQRVRRAQRATWFPLVVLAAVTFVAIPVYRYSSKAKGACETVRSVAGPANEVCTVSHPAGFIYWPVALVLGYAGIAVWYLHTSRARGVGTRVWPYVTVGIVFAALTTGVSLWTYHHIGSLDSQVWASRLASPAVAVGLGLLVLAWAERNRALLVFTLGYLVIVLAPVNFGWAIAPPSLWSSLPHLAIQGSVLLLAGIGFALAQQRGTR